ncbi:hypothetical protein B566_EDAN016789 [Ephemera danica]|nr:hypothetical protein B566_EDAN016789 [Ephemera danica]
MLTNLSNARVELHILVGLPAEAPTDLSHALPIAQKSSIYPVGPVASAPRLLSSIQVSPLESIPPPSLGYTYVQPSTPWSRRERQAAYRVRADLYNIIYVSLVASNADCDLFNATELSSVPQQQHGKMPAISPPLSPSLTGNTAPLINPTLEAMSPHTPHQLSDASTPNSLQHRWSSIIASASKRYRDRVPLCAYPQVQDVTTSRQGLVKLPVDSNGDEAAWILPESESKMINWDGFQTTSKAPVEKSYKGQVPPKTQIVERQQFVGHLEDSEDDEEEDVPAKVDTKNVNMPSPPLFASSTTRSGKKFTSTTKNPRKKVTEQKGGRKAPILADIALFNMFDERQARYKEEMGQLMVKMKEGKKLTAHETCMRNVYYLEEFIRNEGQGRDIRKQSKPSLMYDASRHFKTYPGLNTAKKCYDLIFNHHSLQNHP